MRAETQAHKLSSAICPFSGYVGPMLMKNLWEWQTITVLIWGSCQEWEFMSDDAWMTKSQKHDSPETCGRTAQDGQKQKQSKNNKMIQNNANIVLLYS